MRRAEGKDIWLFGGAGLLTHFINAGLVDEMLLAIHPLVLGGGISLFQAIETRKWFDGSRCYRIRYGGCTGAVCEERNEGILRSLHLIIS